MKVAICVCTYKRPDSLQRLLNSINNLYFPRGEYEVFIADNDSKLHEGLSYINENKDKFSFRISCEVEKKPGISFARNKTVQMVKNSGENFSYIAFTDDDVEVAPHWIRDLVESLELYEADIVCGKSEPRFEHKPDRDILFSPFYHDHYNCLPTGAPIQSGATNNMLMKYEVIKDENENLFDPTLAKVGGEDADLSIRLIQKGFNMIRCSTGVVYETFPEERLNMEWIMSRYYRYGTSYAYTLRKNFSRGKFLYVLFKKILMFPFRYFKTIFFPTTPHKCGLQMELGFFAYIIHGKLLEEYKN